MTHRPTIPWWALFIAGALALCLALAANEAFAGEYWFKTNRTPVKHYITIRHTSEAEIRHACGVLANGCVRGYKLNDDGHMVLAMPWEQWVTADVHLAPWADQCVLDHEVKGHLAGYDHHPWALFRTSCGPEDW